jgi:D-3-phosphoglycerate dehydrogenase
MTDKHILITTSSFGMDGNEALDKIIAEGIKVRLNPYGRRLSEVEAAELLAEPGLIGMIAGVEPLNQLALSAAPQLRVISRCGVGMDNIDRGSAEEFDILLCNTPNAPSIAVAELVVGLILDLLRKISLADRAIRAHAWKQYMGNLLAKQTIGIIGYGGIGRRVAQLLTAFDARVLACDTCEVNAEQGVIICDFERVITQSDIVTLHVPYTSENHHLINDTALNKMKQGAMLINVARGGLVDEKALFAALTAKRISGAALDCFESEPYIGPLTNLDNVVLTAHMGSYALESRQIMEIEAAENLLQGLRIKGLIA